MPELPEVETTRRGLMPHVNGRRITSVTIREPRLRWTVPATLAREVRGQRIETITRRGKYLLFALDDGGCLIIHLGMSGSLRLVDRDCAAGRHEPFDIGLDSGMNLRLRDPRRFGALLWTRDARNHALLKDLGPEPLDGVLAGDYLYDASRRRSIAVRDFLMNSHVIAGIGNIYANEALSVAGIDPRRAAGRIGRDRYSRLSYALIKVLESAIAQGGTTLRDFAGSDGQPGYFQQALRVYGREREPCPDCGAPIVRQTLSGRSCFFCRHCQH
ncbi:MAG: bifunctional DNA-formamidopyrimidine glycosylase/DNA-(apurinic or apyrimidinic site) lyase [Gammaproteobacteria bacterium]|nr:bifunctional DNA-formamidopyrimidine glycosylase/DNA-(apurinic or apyrimidinic site) lyase [Gammaproteobacteria bacterium]